MNACYICGRDVEPVPIHVQMHARREMNVPVWIGPDTVRHSYCAPGTLTWARHVDRSDPHARAWLRRFGYDPDRVGDNGEDEMAKSKNGKKARAPKVKKARKVKSAGLAPGTLLRRGYKGTDYEVRVGAEGFTMGGAKFTSLTAVAKKITGYKAISGPKFFEAQLAEKAASA